MNSINLGGFFMASFTLVNSDPQCCAVDQQQDIKTMLTFEGTKGGKSKMKDAIIVY